MLAEAVGHAHDTLHGRNPIAGLQAANFFEARATEYSKAATKGQWHGGDGVWSEFDRLMAKRSENTLPAE